MKRTLTTLLALAACTAAGAETAAAADAVRTDYAVTIEGEAFYNVARVTHTEDGEQTHHEDDQFTFRTEMPKVSFFDHVGGDPETSMGSATGVRGHLATVNPNGARIDCDGSEVTDFRPGRIDARYADGHTTYDVRVLEAVQLKMDCSGLGPYEKRFDTLGSALGNSSWDDEFTMPGGSIGQDEIRVPISNKVTGPECPGFDEETTLCELSWEAEVVFRKTGWEDVKEDPEELNVPIVKPQPQPAPEPQPQPAKAAFETLPGAKLGATSLSVPVACAAGCTGTATVTLAGGKARAAAVKPLARKAFTVAPGATKRIVVTIPKRARKAVKRAGGVKVTLAVTPTGGTRTTKRLTVRR
ncbi:MAG: hypothetical protein M3389_07570 [Actinomycetota bacterium]|nr:hypothetical protein [Actinomycetota bacterium]